MHRHDRLTVRATRWLRMTTLTFSIFGCESFAEGDAEDANQACGLDSEACPSGCQPIQARGFDPDGETRCLGDFETLGCVTSGTIVTADSRCGKSPEGRLYGISGTLLARLIAGSGYSECSNEERERYTSLEVCAQ